MSKTTKADIEAALAIIEECKNSHTHWSRELRAGRYSPEYAKIGGGRAHHDRWVTNYQHVLAVLRSI